MYIHKASSQFEERREMQGGKQKNRSKNVRTIKPENRVGPERGKQIVHFRQISIAWTTKGRSLFP